MSNTTDMSTPVTRGELQEELAKLATKAELNQEVQGLRELITTTEQGLRELIKTSEQDLRELIMTTRKELQADLAMHAGALFDSMSALIKGYDDKYKDLPGRVTRLEAKVFKRPARR